MMPTAEATEYGRVRHIHARQSDPSNAGSSGVERLIRIAATTTAATPAGVGGGQNDSSGVPASTSATTPTAVPAWRSSSTAVTQPSRRLTNSGREEVDCRLASTKPPPASSVPTIPVEAE